MKRINFRNYIKQLPSNTVLEYLSSENTPKILTNGVYEKISETFCTIERISDVCEKTCADTKNELIHIYLYGNFGKKAINAKIKSEILRTFLVFEGAGENESLLFGFPDLAEIIAKIFSKQVIIEEKGSDGRLPFFGTFFNDFVIILDMLRSNDGKICNNGAYSQRFTELIKERCGIGKLFENHCDLVKIIDLVITVSQSCGASFSRNSGNITLLSNLEELLAEIIKTAKNPHEILRFSKIIDFSFLEMLVSNCENTVKFDEKFIENIADGIDFSLKIFHWFGLAEYFGKNTFRIRKTAKIQYQNGHILNDFNIYIPIETNPLHLGRILCCVKIIGVDVIYRGKIDKKRVEESLAVGVSENEIIEILQIWDAPVAVKESIAEWSYSFNRAFSDLPYIAFRNDVAASIAQYCDLKGKITPIDGYTFFAVKNGEEKSVIETLEKFGFDLRKCEEKPQIPLIKIERNDDDFIKFNPNPSFTAMETSKTLTKYSGLMIPFSSDNRTLLNYAVVMEKNIKIELSDFGVTTTEAYKILDVANGFIKVEDKNRLEKNIPYTIIKRIGIDE
jgi:hypothetical protein